MGKIIKSIVLTGFMGSGKSVVAKSLAELLKGAVVYTDAVIEAKENRTIVDIFRDSGESYFRKLEKEVVKDISSKGGLIIDCGGGIVLDAQNVENLKKNGVVFFLSASPEIIYKRLRRQKNRPLLNVDDPMARIKELLDARMPYYLKADHTIETDQKAVKKVASEIMEIMTNE